MQNLVVIRVGKDPIGDAVLVDEFADFPLGQEELNHFIAHVDIVDVNQQKLVVQMGAH